jgi:hypothetical protein
MLKRLKRRLDLFKGYYADAEFDGTFTIKEKGILKSPHIYSAVELLTPHVYAFTRANEPKVDLLFSDLSWLMGLVDVYDVIQFSGGKNAPVVIAAVHDDGTELLLDDGRPLMFIHGFPHYTIHDERFVVVFDPDKRGPYVRVYTFLGELVTEGFLWDALSEASKWRPKPKQ